MRKLNQRKVRWIIREIKRGELSIYRIAKQQEITPRWTRELYRRYQESGNHPYPKQPGRKVMSVSEEERALILKMKQNHPVGAVSMEKLLRSQDIHIPHNRIYRILKKEGLVKDEPKKQKRRKKWVRYQRRHSNSLWHVDWFEENGEQVIIFEDDASRLVTGLGVFSNATAKNTVTTLRSAIQKRGTPKQIISDHGPQFTAMPRDSCSDPAPNDFQKYLEEHNIKHIKARVKHPQSNGKVERVYQTIFALKKHFGTWEKAVEYYNFERPHMSLENGALRTPYQAFLDKQRKNKNS
jgi:putative transposase